MFFFGIFYWFVLGDFESGDFYFFIDNIVVDVLVK